MIRWIRMRIRIRNTVEDHPVTGYRPTGRLPYPSKTLKDRVFALTTRSQIFQQVEKMFAMWRAWAPASRDVGEQSLLPVSLTPEVAQGAEDNAR